MRWTIALATLTAVGAISPGPLLAQQGVAAAQEVESDSADQGEQTDAPAAEAGSEGEAPAPTQVELPQEPQADSPAEGPTPPPAAEEGAPREAGAQEEPAREASTPRPKILPPAIPAQARRIPTRSPEAASGAPSQEAPSSPGQITDMALARWVAADLRAGIEVARMALERGEHPEVRRFAQQAIGDYERMLSQLKAAVDSAAPASSYQVQRPALPQVEPPPGEGVAAEALEQLRAARAEREIAVAERAASPLTDRSEGIVNPPRTREEDPSAATYRDVQTQSSTLPVNPVTEEQQDVEQLRERLREEPAVRVDADVDEDEPGGRPTDFAEDLRRPQLGASPGAAELTPEADARGHDLVWIRLKDRLAARSSVSDRAMLAAYEGSALDAAFLGLHAVRARRLQDALEVFAAPASEALRPALQESRTAVEGHLRAASELRAELP